MGQSEAATLARYEVTPRRPALSRHPIRRRLFAVLVVTVLLFTGVTARLTQLQVFSSSWLATKGQDQRIKSIQLAADRGSIFDRNGYELALSVPQKTVWADPKLVQDAYRSSALLSPLLNKSQQDIESLLRTNGRFVYLARKVTDDVANNVKELKLPGVAMYDEPKRFLPENDLLAPVLGKVGIDDEGLSGLEVQYAKQLSGTAGRMVVEQDPGGRDIPGGLRNTQQPVRGDDLMLTIDRDLQHKVEAALTAEIQKADARGGMAAMMDTQTGEVLALANLSVPNNGRGSPVVPSPNNMALTNVYEPGSVNKIITISGALEEKLVNPSTSAVVGNSIRISDGVFKEHEDHSVVPWSTTQVVANSSNVGTIQIAQKLGKDRLDKYLRAFGFGHATGTGFPGESKGLMLDPKKYSGTSLPTIAIGQGVAVTAMQMLAATNTIANGGVYVQPKLVKSTIDQNGKTHDTPASPTHPVVSRETAKEMSSMLHEVVRVGTATAGQIDGYEVSGKTGTARKPKAGGSGYEEGAYVSSFAGFVPTEQPRLTGIVVLDQPTPIFGGLVAAPVFSDIARYGLQMHNIAPVASPPGNNGVPYVDEASATSVGEADAKAGTTKAEADAAKANADGGSTTSTISPTTTASPAKKPVQPNQSRTITSTPAPAQSAARREQR